MFGPGASLRPPKACVRSADIRCPNTLPHRDSLTSSTKSSTRRCATNPVTSMSKPNPREVAFLRRLTVANRAEFDMAGCLTCVEGVGTAQVVRYVRNGASEEVVRGHVPGGCQVMNAITLHQPWASLMAAQLKYIETLDWIPPTRCLFRRMALHAASKRSKHYPRLHVLALERQYGPLWKMPFGAVVATAMLMSVCQVAGHSDLGDILYTFVEGREPPGGIGEAP